MTAIVLALVLAVWSPLKGGFTQHDLAQVRAAPASGAAAPLDLRFVDQDGRPKTLAEALGGRPGVLVFADYTCTYLCGPGLVLTARALDDTHLRPDRDYSFVVVGINPRDGPAQAMQMRRRLHAGAGAAAQLLSEGPTAPVAAALGYRYLYNAAVGQYAHDTSVYILSPAGRVVRLLPQFALTPAALTAAIEHPTPPAGPLAAPLRFICACLQPLSGAFDSPVQAALRIGGVASLLAGAFAFVAFRRRERRR